MYVMLVGAYPFEDPEDPRNFRKTIAVSVYQTIHYSFFKIKFGNVHLRKVKLIVCPLILNTENIECSILNTRLCTCVHRVSQPSFSHIRCQPRKGNTQFFPGFFVAMCISNLILFIILSSHSFLAINTYFFKAHGRGY